VLVAACLGIAGVLALDARDLRRHGESSDGTRVSAPYRDGEHVAAVIRDGRAAARASIVRCVISDAALLTVLLVVAASK
jgi:hypothetical protein